MSYLMIGICSLIIFIILIVVQVITRAKRPGRNAIFSIIIGLLALGAVNLTGFITGVTLPVSLLSLGISAVGGIPGVTMMLLVNMII